MALIKCPECSKEISDVASVCPNCGFPIKADAKKQAKSTFNEKEKPIKNTNIAKVAIATIILVVVGGIGMLMYNRYKTAQELNAKEEKYQKAVNLVSNREMEEARKILEDLTGYKDSDALLKETRKSAYELLNDEERDFFNKLVIAAEWDRDYMIREYPHSNAKLSGLLHIDDDRLFEITAIQKKHLNSEKYFEYLNNRYQYEENEGLFVPITFFINRYTMSEILKMKTGIPNMDLVHKLSQIYGPNKIKIRHQGIVQSILKEASDFAYLYVLICMIIWIIMKLYLSSIIVGITSVILIIISSKNKLDNIQSLSGEENKSSFVIREGVEIEIKSESIVPGDIIVLRPGEDGQIYIPCDGIILEGFCTVNESDLTGENTLVLKKEILLPKNKNEYFINYLKQIYQGITSFRNLDALESA